MIILAFFIQIIVDLILIDLFIVYIAHNLKEESVKEYY